MRRITLWALSTVAAVVLLFSYRTSTMGPAGAQTSPSSGSNDRSGASGPGSRSGTSPEAARSSPATAGRASRTTAAGRDYRGEVAQTQWGPVQVAITVRNGRIAEVEVLAHPTGSRRSDDINAYALPILRKDTLTAQSADVDTVSGATVTSDGYRRSLQAAIDAAHL